MAAAKQAVRRKPEPAPRAAASSRSSAAAACSCSRWRVPSGATACRRRCSPRCRRPSTGPRGDAERARGRHRRQGPRLLRRPRPQGADRASPGCATAAAPTTPADHAPVRRADALDRALPQAGDRRRAGHRARPPAASSWPPATWRWLPRRRPSARPASTSGCSAPRRWWRCRATSRASGRWRCCCWARCCPRARRPSTASSTAWCRPAKLMDEAMALADRIASKPPATLAIGKEAFYRQIEMAARRRLRLCRRRHGAEHDACRVGGGHRRLPGEAGARSGTRIEYARLPRIPRHEPRQLHGRVHRRHPRPTRAPSPWWGRAPPATGPATSP